MENYTVINNSYEAVEGYCFRNKTTGSLCGGLSLAENDSIDNYEVIERPIEDEIEEVTDNG